MARPMPREAPVTIQIWPDRTPSIIFAPYALLEFRDYKSIEIRDSILYREKAARACKVPAAIHGIVDPEAFQRPARTVPGPVSKQ